METRENEIQGVKLNKLFLFVFMFLLIGLWGTSAFSLDMMGPPAAELQFGQTRAGMDFTSSKMDLELTNGIYTDFLDGVFDYTDLAIDITLKDLKINRAYASFGYGGADYFEMFFRVGGFNAKFDDTIWEDSESFESGSELAVGGGVKFTMFQENNLKIGGLFQISNSGFDGKLSAPHWSSFDYVEVDMTEAQLAVGVLCECNENVSVYGGPFLHFANGTITDDGYNRIDSVTGGLLTSEYKWDIQQESTFGGYMGVEMNFAENCSFNLEYQQTSDARAFGMGILWKF